MNRLLRVVPLLGIFALARGMAACGGGTTMTPPPPACTNTSTIKCTQSGAVQGVSTGSLYAFRGIPYAAPAVGNLRWKVPQPPISWQGVRDASTFGNVCPQINSAGQYAGDEDCLVLNVYVS